MSTLQYDGGDPAEALAFFKANRTELKTLRRVRVDFEGSTVYDINGAQMFLQGLTFGQSELVDLLKLAGASYNPATLHDPPAGTENAKTFSIVRSDPWGHDRVL